MPHLTNITRPAVLRNYFGRNVEALSPMKWVRYTYGSPNLHGTISTDPRQYNTKPMCEDMYCLGKRFAEHAKSHYINIHQNTDFLDHDYNHCTVLIYHPHGKNTNCKLSYHCDSSYTHDGRFSPHNTMKEHSDVLVYTMGDDRTLYFRVRKIRVSDKSRHKCVNDNHHFHKLVLSDKSLFVLHPLDEKPMVRAGDRQITQIQHGNVKVEEGNLSIAFVFRSVTQKEVYDNINDFKCVDHSLLELHKNTIKQFDETKKKFDKEKEDIVSNFNNISRKKMTTWGWL